MTKIKRIDLDQIVVDMLDMGIFSIEDIQQYGFTALEAKEIQKEINRR